MKSTLKYLYCLVACVLFPFLAKAQVFGDSELSAPSQTTQPATISAPVNKFEQNKETQKLNALQNINDTKKAADKNSDLKQTNTTEQKKVFEVPPSSTTPEIKVKKNLPSAVKQFKIVNGKRVEQEASEAIYIFYTNFKMVRSYGSTACDMRFVLLTKLEETLSEIGMRLVWPNATVKLNFSNVKPAVRNFYDYRMYGDGCYSLDKLPNVTINRCRLKGRSQQECASLVKIMKETN